jgi:hypothetical protein
MESEERVKEAISQIAQRRNNVTLEEIEWVVKKLSEWHATRQRKAKHGVLFSVAGHRFMVNCHNPGSKQVKKYSVDAFIDAMIELGWFDEAET